MKIGGGNFKANLETSDAKINSRVEEFSGGGLERWPEMSTALKCNVNIFGGGFICRSEALSTQPFSAQRLACHLWPNFLNFYVTLRTSHSIIISPPCFLLLSTLSKIFPARHKFHFFSDK